MIDTIFYETRKNFDKFISKKQAYFLKHDLEELYNYIEEDFEDWFLDIFYESYQVWDHVNEK